MDQYSLLPWYKYYCLIHNHPFDSETYPGLCNYKSYFEHTNLNKISTRENLINIITNLENELNECNKKIKFYKNKNIRTIYKNNGSQIQNPLNLYNTVYN